ncbi:TniQ family protein [Mycobacterium sp. M26]|uniref:TniQ family protein n=1 Tax=Mycobacterium sp. M26 TaxID=1762962 RepID=UPI00073E2218|nr:TniQ family protein [Mycobacterium sp. M26]
MNPGTTPRTLPIRVPPLPGEALDSWLEYLSHRLRTTHGDILAAVGLDRPAAHAARATHTTGLPAGAAEAISAATGISVPQVHAMTLARYGAAGEVVSLGVRFPRSRPRYSRFCPHCLDDDHGRWQLRWRLGYSFACQAHRCLLADACPDCGKAQRDRVFPGELTAAPGLCGHRAPDGAGRLARRCGADLRAATTLPLHTEHPTLRAQLLIDTAIDDGAASFGVYRDHTAPTTDFLTDLRALGARALSPAVAAGLAELIPADLHTAYRATLTLGRPAARPLAILTAVALTAAVAVLGEDNPDDAAARLTRLENLTQQNGASLDWPSAGWARGTSAAVTALRLRARAPRLTPLTQLRYRIGTPRPALPELDTAASKALASRLPATLWAPWAVRLRPPQLDPARLAASLSAALLMVNSRIKAPDAHQVLGSAAPWRTTTHHLRALAQHGYWPDTRAALIRLAEHLHHHDVPIDYQRRRSLDYTALLPQNTWTAICTNLDIRPGGSERLRLMRCQLYTTISGNPLDQAPWLRDTNQFRSACFRYPVLLTPALRTALDDYAATFLYANGIDEPLTWQPPLELVADLNLPGADPDRLSLAAIHRMIRHGQSLTAVAEHLNTTADAVRYALTVHPAPAVRRGPPRSCATSTNTSGCRCGRSRAATAPAGKSSPLWHAVAASHCDPRNANPSWPQSTATGSTPNTSTTSGPFQNSPPKEE